MSPPLVSTDWTPGTAEKARSIVSLEMRCRSTSGCGPEAATVSTGNALVSNLVIEGGSASAGNLPRAELTTRSTSTGASSEFAAVVNWIDTFDTPSLEVDVIVSMFGSAATASSIGLVTWLSIVAGSAPASVVVMMTSGKLMFGVMPTPIDR